MSVILVRYFKPSGWIYFLPNRWLHIINWWSDVIEKKVFITKNSSLNEVILCVKHTFKDEIPNNADIGLMFIETTLDSWNQSYECIKDTRYIDYEGSFIIYLNKMNF